MFSSFFTWPASPEKCLEKTPSISLPGNQKTLYLDLVTYLLEQCAHRAHITSSKPKNLNKYEIIRRKKITAVIPLKPDPLLPSQEKPDPRLQPRVYQVIFIQSESWKKVRDLLGDIPFDTVINKAFVLTWTQLIESLEVAQKEYRKFSDKYPVSIERSNKASSMTASREATQLKELNEKGICETIELLKVCKKDILSHLAKDLKNTLLKKCPEIQKMLNFIEDRKDLLFAFLTWHLVDMYTRTVFFNISYRVHLGDAKLKRNRSILFSFRVSEKIFLKQLKYQETEVTLVTPIKLVRKKKHKYVNPSPPLKELPYISDEDLYGIKFLDDEKCRKKETQYYACQLHKKFDRITNLVLTQVNERILSEKSAESPRSVSVYHNPLTGPPVKKSKSSSSLGNQLYSYFLGGTGSTKSDDSRSESDYSKDVPQKSKADLDDD